MTTPRARPLAFMQSYRCARIRAKSQPGTNPMVPAARFESAISASDSCAA
jgi:hypothetical protein